MYLLLLILPPGSASKENSITCTNSLFLTEFSILFPNNLRAETREAI